MPYKKPNRIKTGALVALFLVLVVAAAVVLLFKIRFRIINDSEDVKLCEVIFNETPAWVMVIESTPVSRGTTECHYSNRTETIYHLPQITLSPGDPQEVIP